MNANTSQLLSWGESELLKCACTDCASFSPASLPRARLLCLHQSPPRVSTHKVPSFISQTNFRGTLWWVSICSSCLDSLGGRLEKMRHLTAAFSLSEMWFTACSAPAWIPLALAHHLLQGDHLLWQVFLWLLQCFKCMHMVCNRHCRVVITAVCSKPASLDANQLFWITEQ